MAPASGWRRSKKCGRGDNRRRFGGHSPQVRSVRGGCMTAVRHSLDPFFRPRSVAVFGASAAPGSVGAILMRNLLGNPFGGGVYPINPKRRTVLGVHCYPDLASVPEAVDL